MKTRTSFLLILALAVLPSPASDSPPCGGCTPNPAVSPDDRQKEIFLLQADVIERETIGSGITKPLRLSLRLGEKTGLAAFKSINVQRLGYTRFRTAANEFNFQDNHRYERAAYILDRFLGIHMVPVAVIREIDGKEGALIDWVLDTINENDRRQNNRTPPDPVRLLRQRDVMRIFDVLILNADRNMGNQLVSMPDWKLHLIDHSRAFRLKKKIPDDFVSNPITIPEELYQRMKAMDLKTLRPLLRGLVSKAQIGAMLARRDSILEKIDSDREKYGDALVFQ